MQQENLYAPNHIRTVSGMYVNILNPDPATILIEDIAHGLCNMPRFGGQLKHFYSVAQHSLAVSKRLDPEHMLAGLLHDASEAYLMDLPKPIKDLMPEYKQAEDRLMRVIAEKFGFQYPIHESVKIADKEELEREWQWLMIDEESWKKKRKIVREYFVYLFDKLTKRKNTGSEVLQE